MVYANAAGDRSFAHSLLGLSLERTNVGGVNLPAPTSYIRDDKGKLVAQRPADPLTGKHYYLFDGLGSVVALTNESGEVAGRYRYEPYGKIINKDDLSLAAKANPWRFAAGYYDDRFDLYKFGTRYYSAGLGRWTQQDPNRGKITDPTGLNPYQYGGCDPVNKVDPRGTDHEDRFDFLADQFDSPSDLLGHAVTCIQGTGVGAPVGLVRIGPVAGGVAGCVGFIGIKLGPAYAAEHDE